MWKGNVWINMLYISSGTKQCRAVFQKTMTKLLQDMNLSLKQLTVTFTIRTIQMSCFWFFFSSWCFFFCAILYFFCLFKITRKQMYLSFLFLPLSSCPFINIKCFTDLIPQTAEHGVSCSLGFTLKVCSL